MKNSVPPPEAITLAGDNVQDASLLGTIAGVLTRTVA